MKKHALVLYMQNICTLFHNYHLGLLICWVDVGPYCKHGLFIYLKPHSLLLLAEWLFP